MEELIISNSNNSDYKVQELQYVKDLQSFFTENNFIEQFLQNKGIQSKNTETTYRNAIKKFFNKETQDITIEDINKVNYYTCYDFISRLNEEHYASSTIYNYIAALSSLYKWLMKYNDKYVTVVKENPFSLLKDDRPKLTAVESEYLSVDEMKRVLARINPDNGIIDLRDKIILGLMFTTALRKSDIINIKIKDIICVQGMYCIKSIIIKVKREHLSKIQPPLKLLIDRYISETGRSYENDREDYLFKGHNKAASSKHISPRSITNIVNRRVADAGINKHIKVHGTRHSAIQAAIDNGIEITKVQAFAEHKSINSTIRYVHTRNNIKNNPGDTIDVF